VAFVSFEGINTDITDDVIASLEEIHPKLSDIFAAASRTLSRAETEEDLAQAFLSGRRILEQLASYLYPPSKTEYKGRKVGNAEYKNRLWAYIEMTIEETSKDLNLLTVLGKEADRLIELFNKGLHAKPTKLKVEESFRDLVYWIQKVIELSPEKVRKPYLPYEYSLY
jgi:hypothetical protein